MNSDSLIKILFLAADPSNASRLRLLQEIRDIKDRLRITRVPEKFKLEQRESVRVIDITQAIFDIEPQIVHFSGHGMSTGELAFENEVGEIQPVEPEALAAMFELFAEQVNCVILNACYSEIQAKVIAEHIPFVIGMNQAIGDKAAIAFSVGFYKALGANRSLEEAYKFGCVEIRLQGIPEHLTPVIYLKKNLIPAPQLKTTTEKRVVVRESFPAVSVWQGRDELLQALKARLLQLENPPKVLALIGQGGIGKTSLAVKLLEALGVDLGGSSPLTHLEKGESSQEFPYECVMYFKVQEGISFDDVAEFILIDGLGIETTESLKDAKEKIAKIIQGLAKTRCLIVLDNLEAILHPAKHPQARRSISPDWGKLLNALVYQQHCSQTLLTSREVPADLADPRYEDAEPDSELVYIECLKGVATEAGVEILRLRQLKDTQADLRWISEQVEGHVFLLTQLAAVGKGKPGYLHQHPELVTKKAEPILREQLARQSEAARDLLRRMCVLRVGIEMRGLTFLRLCTDDCEKDNRFKMAVMRGEPAEFTEEEVSETEAILEQLVDSSLVQSRYNEHKCELFYDLHRVIAEFLQSTYKNELPSLLQSAYDYYRSIKNLGNPQRLDDLRSVLEAQFFAFRLGKYSEASELLRMTLDEYLKRWGHWNLLKELYEQILPHANQDEHLYYLREIGIIHRNFGNWKLAERYFQEALSIAQKQDNKSGIADSLQLLGHIEFKRGNWDAAEQWLHQCLTIETELDNRTGMAYSWGCLGNIERERGNWDAAEQMYRQVLQVWEELDNHPGITFAIRCLGETELSRGNLEAAKQLLTEALSNMEQLGMTLQIARTNHRLAQLERQRRNIQLAQKHYNTARQIFQELGAAKELERIEREWKQDV